MANADRRALDLVRVAQLVDALVQGEQAAHAEQHERDDERPEVALRPVAERVLGVGRALAALAPSISRAWLPVSASEWPDSASSPAEPVMRKPTNLATAMPRLAKNAAMIAFRLPSCIGARLASPAAGTQTRSSCMRTHVGQLEGRVALVTGGGRGIGRASASCSLPKAPRSR